MPPKIWEFMNNCLKIFQDDVEIFIFGGFPAYLYEISNEYSDIDILFLNKQRLFNINNIIDIVNTTFKIKMATCINPFDNNCLQIGYDGKQPYKLDMIFEHERSLKEFINDSPFSINKFVLNVLTRELYYYNDISINLRVDLILDLNKNKSKNIKT